MVYGWESQRGTYWTSIRLLVGHLLGTTLIFIVWFGLAWALSVFLYWCNGIHPLPVETFKFVTKIEAGLIYADAAFCAIVAIGGAWRFLMDVLS